MKRKSNNYTFFVFAAMFSLLLSSASAMADGVSSANVKAVQLVINGQIAALKSGDYQSAYSFAAPNVKAAFPSAKIFISMVENGYRPLYHHSSYVFGKNTVSNGEVYQEIIVSDDARKLWQFIYILSQQQDQSWKITNVMMYPFEGSSV
ncbi:MAG: DUF4864 domain-containing protein [Porticoccus sp.]|nr:DUF4864 domain-containing protein [Porticoccus sp.]